MWAGGWHSEPLEEQWNVNWGDNGTPTVLIVRIPWSIRLAQICSTYVERAANSTIVGEHLDNIVRYLNSFREYCGELSVSELKKGLTTTQPDTITGRLSARLALMSAALTRSSLIRLR